MSEDCLLVTKFIISLGLFILKLVCLFIIMLNSKKKEPSMETRYSVLNNSYDWNLTDWNLSDWNYTESKCTEEQLGNFLENGVYVTFNFKMKKINRYSKGLLSLAFIGAFFSLCLFASMQFAYIDREEKVGLYLCSLYNVIIFILDLIFFILLSVYYYKGKYGDFLDFRECDFIDIDSFNDNYGYISKVFKHCKIIFPSYIISLVSDILTVIFLVMMMIKYDK